MYRTRTEDDLTPGVNAIDATALLLCEFNTNGTNFTAYCFGDDLVNMGTDDDLEIGPCQDVVR